MTEKLLSWDLRLNHLFWILWRYTQKPLFCSSSLFMYTLSYSEIGTQLIGVIGKCSITNSRPFTHYKFLFILVVLFLEHFSPWLLLHFLPFTAPSLSLQVSFSFWLLLFFGLVVASGLVIGSSLLFLFPGSGFISPSLQGPFWFACLVHSVQLFFFSLVVGCLLL